MTTKKIKIDYSKFFPDDGGFVTLTGAFNPNILKDKDIFNEEFEMDLTIQTSTGHFINLYSWLTAKDNTIRQLKAINEATAQAIKFYEECAEAKKAMKKAPAIDFAPKRVLKTRK